MSIRHLSGAVTLNWPCCWQGCCQPSAGALAVRTPAATAALLVRLPGVACSGRTSGRAPRRKAIVNPMPNPEFRGAELSARHIDGMVGLAGCRRGRC